MTASASKIIAQFGTTNVTIWAAAALLLLLLVMVGVVAGIISSRQREFTMLVLKTVVFMVLPILAVVPPLVLWAETVDWESIGSTTKQGDAGAVAEAVATSGTVTFVVVFYVVLLAMFCYHLGKRVGREQGKLHIRELVGMETMETIEDAQDRLFESRMRLPSQTEVVESIGRMARAREAARRAEELQAVGREPEVDDVTVESVGPNTAVILRQDQPNEGQGQ